MTGFPREDMHVHSTFSDGTASVAENVWRARELGLERLTLVDHVRLDSGWMPGLVAAVAALGPVGELEILTAAEAKVLDTAGTIDAPDDLCGLDLVYIADHQMPSATGPERPGDVRDALRRGERAPDEVVEALVEATCNALLANPGAIIAHLFSILPKMRLNESAVTDAQIDRLATAAAASGASLELSERWKCPGARVARRFAARGVPILVSSDSHALATLGQFSWCRGTWAELHASRGASASPATRESAS